MAGLSYINDTDWRYDNWGTADLLSVTGTTLKNLSTDKSVTSEAFYQTAQAKCFDLPTTNEIWLKFDVYFGGGSANRWWACNGGSAGISGISSYGSTELDFLSNGRFVRETDRPLISNTLQTVLLHMISGSSAGIIETWIDGAKIYTYTGDVNHGEDFADFYLRAASSGTFFSNVIISNAEIGLDENSVIPFGVPAIKPEIYISWIPTGQIVLKPEIYATIIQAPIHERQSADLNRKISKPESTLGDIELKIGNGEKVSADVSRHVFSTDTAVAETVRRLFVEDKVSGDTRRLIVQSAEIHADTYRDVQSTEKVIGDTSRKIGVTTVNADLHRRINVTTVSNVDTCRRVEVEETTSADVFLKTTCAETARADTYRKVEDPTPTVTRAATKRTVGIREKVSSDTSRAIGYKESTAADTLLWTTSAEKIIADTMRGIREVCRADTSRRVTRAERAVARTVIRIPHVLNYIVQPKQRTLKSSPRLAANNPASLINTFKDYGVTAINITLSEKTLSDNFQFEIAARSVEINEAVQGYLLDYPFSFLVEETNQTELVQSVKGRYSIDDLLYKWFLIPTARITLNGDEYEVPGGRIVKGKNDSFVFIYPTASEVIFRVAHYFGMLPVVSLLNDFEPSNLDGDDMITYSDLLNSVFGWTSRLPHMQINVFIRGGILYCIQRGAEVSVFDITNLPHSRPTINKKFNRVLCHNPNKNGDDDEADDDNRQLFSGDIFYESNNFSLRYSYQNGFLQKEYQRINTAAGAGEGGSGYPAHVSSEDEEWTTTDATNSTEYSYKTFNKYFAPDEEIPQVHNAVQKEELLERYVETKTLKSNVQNTTGTGHTIDGSTKIETDTVTNYHYAKTSDNGSREPEIYLVAEYETTHTTEKEYNHDKGRWEKVSEEQHIKETFHVPAGNGWYGQTVYLDGEFQGANLSQGKPGNRISPYTVTRTQNAFFQATDSLKPAELDPLMEELSMIEDSSFPVRGESMKNTLNAALRWLHRRIEETVTVDLTSRIVDGVPEINHIVDFTERVKLDGAEYFLVSNQISFTPRKLIQKLSLIRWY